MEFIFLWFIAFICLSLPFWLLYHAWSKSKALDQRIEDCDDSLLTDSSVKVTQIVSAPEGTTVTENATLVLVPEPSNQTI
tara:strand:+ start:718 stop:957 length:240 start_codon:yes stop_codon:yes gene_type:complete